MAESMTGKRFYHVAPQSEIDAFIESGATYADLYAKYQQPEWCTYPEALSGTMGCWSLTGNLRTCISKRFCRSCELYKAKRK